jgi:ribosome-binding protein aMBF1 (putative translation factor)
MGPLTWAFGEMKKSLPNLLLEEERRKVLRVGREMRGGAEVAQTLARRMRVQREWRKWTQQELAERAGLSVSMIQKLEAGSVPYVSAVVVKKLADALRRSVDSLIR